MDGKWLPREPVEQLLPHLPLWPGAMMRLADGPLQHNGGDRGVLRNFGGRAGDAETGGLGAGFTERCDAL